MHTPHIRLATIDDANTIVEFNNAMAMVTEGKRLDPALIEAGVRAVLRDPARGFYLVAERDGRVVGQLMVTFEWSDWRNAWFWWIQSVFVEASARRTGVYRALHAAVLERAAAAGDVCGVRLYVEHENTRAQKTYAAVGMNEAHYRLYEVDFVFGRKPGDSK